ncbi:META domain-containing protein [Blastococcus goldschmidtiae]|uniref:META domain-containing protein n=1 Tax=Blastococcus goldschmidtiae TaxID=3075546 RepID=A0ABU2K4A8_9ACTN|nr:META domain-containing protein [Blastococcus sp. DSM 46792]MDT0275004.1 META domain-containing protein [Blastococcus sp. DSM 46792]
MDPRARAVPLLAVVLLGGAAAAGCAGGAGAADAADAADVGPTGTWQLSSGTVDDAALPRPEDARATLDLDDGEAGGTAFCNRWFAGYELDGSAFALSGIGRTEIGCAPEVMAAERAYLDALGAVDSLATDGEELVLTGDGVELRFTPVAPVIESPFTGTRWVLETLVDGPTASSTTGGPATLEVTAEGTLTGSTGCRGLTGRVAIEGDMVRSTELRAGQEKCPADVGAQDRHVVAVLGDGFQVSVDGGRLTLSGPGGRGLVYRAG